MQDPRVAGRLYTEESPFRALIGPDSQSVSIFKTLNCTHKANCMVSELYLNTTAEKRKSPSSYPPQPGTPPLSWRQL